jgi:capsular exopolysaccharide synthesis family protein
MKSTTNFNSKENSESSSNISNKTEYVNNRGDEEVDLKGFFYTLWASKWIILSSILAGGIIALLIAFLLTPIYEGNGTMLIKQPQQGASLTNILGGSGGLSGIVSNSFGIGNGVNIGNEQEVLESRTLFNAMAEKLLNNPIMENGRMYPVLWKDWPDDSLVIPKRNVAARLKKNIAYELLPSTTIIEITYDSPSPLEAASIVNMTMDTYQEISKTKNFDLANSATEFLDTEEVEIQDSLSSAEKNLKNFMETHDIVELEAQTRHLIEQFAELRRKRYEAEVQLQGTNASIEEYEKRLNELKPGLAEKLSNAVGLNIQRLQFKISELKTEKALIYSRQPSLKTADTKPEKITNINSQIVQLQQQIEEETDSLVASSEEFIGFLGEGASNPVISTLTEYSKRLIELRVERLQFNAQIDFLTQQLQEQRQFLENVPENTVDLARLQRNVKVQEELYLAVAKQRAQMNLSARAELGNSRPLDLSLIPEKPSSPNFLLFILIGTFTAGFLSVGFLVMNSVLSNTIWSTKPIKKLGVSLLSVIPVFKSSGKKNSGITNTKNKWESSKISDSFHRLANNLMHAAVDNSSQVFMITSSLDKEGKTTVTGNLALALGETAKNVIVVDTSFRNPELGAYFNVPNQQGLNEVVNQQAALNDVINKTEIPNVHVLNLGKRSPSSTILKRNEFQKTVSLLRKEYDYILFDTSPVSKSSDAVELTDVVDGAVVVAQFGRTKVPELEYTLEQLDKVDMPVLGVILNKYNANKATEYRINAYKTDEQA